MTIVDQLRYLLHTVEGREETRRQARADSSLLYFEDCAMPWSGIVLALLKYVEKLEGDARPGRGEERG